MNKLLVNLFAQAGLPLFSFRRSRHQFAYGLSIEAIVRQAVQMDETWLCHMYEHNTYGRAFYMGGEL